MKKKQLLLTALAFAVCIIWGCKKELYSPVTKVSKNNSDDSVMVPTPFGYRRKADVHIIEPGYQLQYRGNHLVKTDRMGKVAQDYGVQTPLSYLSKSNSGLGSSGLNRNHLTSVTRNSMPANTNPNWDIWANGTEFQTGGALNSFATSWTVPHTPTDSTGNQTIYIFGGLEDTSKQFLLQPVLQWGPSIAGGGQYWGVDNWLITCGTCVAFSTTVTRVYPGTALTGTMTVSGPNGSGQYTYTSSFGSGYTASDLPYTVETQYFFLNNFVEALEAYGITGYSDYPPDLMVKMYPIRVDGVYKVTDWVGTNQNTTYGQHVVLTSDPGEIDLYFHYGNDQTIRSFTKNTCGSATGSSVADTVQANTFIAASTGAANTAAVNYLNGGAGQANANAKGYCSESFTFQMFSNSYSITYFNLSVNGTNISGSRSIIAPNENDVTGTVIMNSNSTVVMHVTSGYMPVSAIIRGPYPDIHGVISGSTITFTGVNLTMGNSCALIIN